MSQRKTQGGRQFSTTKTLIQIATDSFWSVSNGAFQQIKDPKARYAAETVFYNTVGFAAAGLAFGSVGGPKGMAIGGVTGAACGLVCGAIVVTQNKSATAQSLSLVPPLT